jgi:hypothetical protein
MGVYKRGSYYWFKFRFLGQVIREPARTTSKTVAQAAERTRRRELELSYNGVPSSSGLSYGTLYGTPETSTPVSD